MAMAKIDTSGWKEFRVGDYFHGIRGTSRKMQGLDEGETPVIAAARYNQGIAGYYDVPSEYENAITISCNGVGCGSTYYHDYPFAITGDAIVLENIGNVPIGALHFIASVYDAYFSRKYSYTDKCSADKAEAECILLPATSDGSPDWDYMESYMKAVMKESEASLESLKQADDKKTAVDISQWKEFVIGELFPKIKKPPVFHNRQVIEDENGIPYIVRTKFDNGIKCRVQRNDEMKPSPAGVISFGAENATFFYQREEFVSGRDIYYIDTQDLSDGACMFLTACLQPIARKYSYNYGLFPDLLKLEHIKLPVDSRGCPDWAYMDSYMRDVIQNAESNIKIMSKSLA